MTDILEQGDNDLELYNDGDFNERDVLGEDDDNDVVKDESTSNNGGSKTGSTPKAKANDSDLYDAAIEPSEQHGSSSAVAAGNTGSSSGSGSKTDSPLTSRHANNNSGAVASQSSNPSQARNLPALGTSSSATGRRYCCYIGNMTWWTTDIDLQTLILACGVSDLIDIKFYENRNNGQSKGFALAVFQSESAVKTVMEKLPQRTLHGQQLVVLPYTKASLAKFEDATRRLDQRTDKKDPKKEEVKGPFLGTIRIGMPPPVQQPQQPQMTLPPPVTLRPQVQVPPPIPSLRPPAQVPMMIPQQQPPQVRAPPPAAQSVPLAGIAVGGAPINLNAPPPAIPGQVPIGGAPQMNRPPPTFPHPTQGVPPLSSAGSMPQTTAPPTSHPPPGFPPPGAHINPQIYRQNFGGNAPNSVEGLSEAEFEEIMNRNRTVSSSAITRAVSDAAANDYASAIETLVTAISLIKQSAVANDERCKVLIASLQDTLRGIEAKSFNSNRKRHSNRDRSRTPERSSRKRHRRTSRSRSRSRERYEYSPRHSSVRRTAY